MTLNDDSKLTESRKSFRSDSLQRAMQGELKYSPDGQSLCYYSELPSIGSMPGHVAVPQSHLQSAHMQFAANSSPISSATSNNGLVSSSLHQMHHSINGNGNGVIVVHGGDSPDHHQINSNSPNSTKKKRKLPSFSLFLSVFSHFLAVVFLPKACLSKAYHVNYTLYKDSVALPGYNL